MVMDTSVELVDVSFTFIENIFWSGLTLVISNHQNQGKKIKDYLKKKLDCQMDQRETNSDHEMEKKIICIIGMEKGGNTSDRLK